MAVQAVLHVKNCTRCRRFEAREKLPKMVTIGATEPLDLVHIDFVGMETTVTTRQKTRHQDCISGHRSLHPVYPRIRC